VLCFRHDPGLKIIWATSGRPAVLSLAHQHGGWHATAGAARSFATPLRAFYITNSGSSPIRLCGCMMEMGIDRICSRVTIRLSTHPPGTKWTDHPAVVSEDKEKLVSGNARRLLKINTYSAATPTPAAK